MQKQNEEEILIASLPTEEIESDDTEYEPFRGDEPAHKKGLKVVPAQLNKLSANLHTFLSQMQTVLNEIPETLGEFKLDEIEVSAGLTASGKFVIFGIGAEGGLEGGLRFAFKRITKDKQGQTSGEAGA